MEHIAELPLPRFRNHFEIKVDEDGIGRKTLVARVNFASLGWAANLQRGCGKITRLCVMELAQGDYVD